MITCVGWQITLCNPIWQVMLRCSEMETLRNNIQQVNLLEVEWSGHSDQNRMSQSVRSKRVTTLLLETLHSALHAPKP